MKKQLVTAGITAAVLAANISTARAAEDNSQVIGTGIGAVAGGLLAGPVGLLAGGLIGNLAGRHDAATRQEPLQTASDGDSQTEAPSLHASAPSTETNTNDVIVVSQAEDVVPIIDATEKPDSGLKDIIVYGVGLDVLFLTGSTTVEALYQPRLQAIAEIMQTLPDVQIYLDGYSDRRGDNDANLDLSSKRLDSVRDPLVQSGVEPDRIHVNALGEQRFMSKPGDLEAYTFDRRVVVRFEYPVDDAARPIAMTQAEALK